MAGAAPRKSRDEEEDEPSWSRVVATVAPPNSRVASSWSKIVAKVAPPSSRAEDESDFSWSRRVAKVAPPRSRAKDEDEDASELECSKLA